MDSSTSSLLLWEHCSGLCLAKLKIKLLLILFTSLIFRTGGGSWSGGGGILGQGFQSPPLRRRWLRSLGGGLPTLKSNSREEVCRNPRPTKTRQTLERLRLGLRGCVSLAEDELSDVKSSLSDLSVNSANQVKLKLSQISRCVESDRKLFLCGCSFLTSLSRLNFLCLNFLSFCAFLHLGEGTGLYAWEGERDVS